MLRGVDLASICFVFFLFVFVFLFFFLFLFWVDCGGGLVGFDLDQLVFFWFISGF